MCNLYLKSEERNGVHSCEFVGYTLFTLCVLCGKTESLITIIPAICGQNCFYKTKPLLITLSLYKLCIYHYSLRIIHSIKRPLFTRFYKFCAQNHPKMVQN